MVKKRERKVWGRIITTKSMNNEGRRESYYRPLSAFCEHMKKNNGYRFFVASMYEIQ